jgi:hypothetical protein
MRQSSNGFAVSKGLAIGVFEAPQLVERADCRDSSDRSQPSNRSRAWMCAAVATVALAIAACETPSSLAPGGQSPLQISTDGRLERGAAITLHVTRNGAPVTDGDVTWTTTSGAMVRLIQPDTAVLADSGAVSISARVGALTTTTTLRVAAPPMIVFAMHDVEANGSLGNYDVYRASLATPTGGDPRRPVRE